MLELSRVVRFSPGSTGDARQLPRDNTFSAWPPVVGLGRFYQLDVRCAGEPDPVTGYFMNITHIDRAVREHALPLFSAALDADPSGATVPLGDLLRRVVRAIQPPLHGSVVSTRLDLSPYYSLMIRSAQMDRVTIRQQFEFAAAHRLHVDALSDERNREVFGKCNNPAGHGHNYRLEVAVAVPIDAAGRVVPVHQLDRWVNTHVIEKFDHKHLNVDVPQFRSPGGLNPSCENIAKVIFDLLRSHERELADAAELEEVSVWETSKTVCTVKRPSR